jgi:signal transduction histidine kinase
MSKPKRKVEAEENFTQSVCDVLFEISQGECSLDDDVIAAMETDLDRRSVYTGLLMLHDDLRYQHKQREAAQYELLQREERLRAIFDLAKVGILDCRVDGIVRELDKIGGKSNGKPLEEYADVVRTLTGKLRIESANREVLNMLQAEDVASLLAHLAGVDTRGGGRLFGTMWRALAEGRHRVEVEGTLATIDGSVLTVQAGLSVPEGGGGDMAILTIADISAHHAKVIAEKEAESRAEELSRVNREVERLFYAVAHDLRSPLRAVDTLASWIIDDFEAGEIDEVRDHVETLRARVTRLDRMLNDLLSYAKIGRTQHPVEDVDVDALILEITTSLLQVPAGFQVRWRDMPSLVTHRTLLLHVFQNLINNAIKHHDGHEGIIEITVDDAGSHYTFRVTDDGPGIPESFRQRIFNLFSTLKRRDEVEGSGMGLAFVQKVVRRIGGHVQVEGPEGRGTTFRFDWPKIAPAEEARGRVSRATDSN